MQCAAVSTMVGVITVPPQKCPAWAERPLKPMDAMYGRASTGALSPPTMKGLMAPWAGAAAASAARVMTNRRIPSMTAMLPIRP